MNNVLSEKLEALLAQNTDNFEQLLSAVGLNKKTDLAGMDLSDTELSGLDFSHCNFRNSDLTRANFEGANLQGADLRGAILIDTNFRECNLIDINLEGTPLLSATFEDSKINELNLDRKIAETLYCAGAQFIDPSNIDIIKENRSAHVTNNQSAPLKIVIVDDHDLVRIGVARMLNDINGFKVIAEAQNGEEAIDLCKQVEPDLVIMDLKMPGIGGIEATKSILLKNPCIKIIALTGVSDETAAERFMQTGASGYVTKGSGFDEVSKAISVVASGKTYMSNDIEQSISTQKNLTSNKDSSPFDTLSERERQTMVMLSSGLSLSEIADTFNISNKTVLSYKYRIFSKLEVNSDAELALLAVKYNIIELD